MTKIVCPNCNKEAEFEHLHDTAHGITSTHMSGTERYTCKECSRSIYKAEGEKLNLKFVCD